VKDAGSGDRLAKTGDGYVVPLMTVGIGLIVGGGITLRASRRSVYLRHDL
jgi:LPXTG-motif cell wall-anchored protein